VAQISMDGGRWREWREESSGVKSLSVTVGGQEASRQGVVEERARHSGVDEGDGAKKGNGGGRRLLWRPEGAAQREGADGVRGLAPRGGENGEERGGGGSGGQLGRLASALDRWVWVAPLPRDKGGRRGASDAGASVCHVGPGDVGARWQ
jgi:hypothetical protein